MFLIYEWSKDFPYYNFHNTISFFKNNSRSLTFYCSEYFSLLSTEAMTEFCILLLWLGWTKGSTFLLSNHTCLKQLPTRFCQLVFYIALKMLSGLSLEWERKKSLHVNENKTFKSFDLVREIWCNLSSKLKVSCNYRVQQQQLIIGVVVKPRRILESI